MASAGGNALLDRWRTRQGRRGGKTTQENEPSWAERRLRRASWKIAFLVGAVINLPGPFYLLALGKIANGGYGIVQQVGLILLFNAIMFLLLEVPLVGYLVWPEATARRVTAMSRWLNANGLRITGWFVGLIGASLVGQGIAAPPAEQPWNLMRTSPRFPGLGECRYHERFEREPLRGRARICRRRVRRPCGLSGCRICGLLSIWVVDLAAASVDG